MSYLGESIPKLGFGLMRLPRLEDGETIDIEQVKQMVDTFLEAGGTYFDTARAYGESENAIRQALVERYPRESFQLATKNAAWIGPKSYEDARKDFDISIENTGAGYFDFYHPDQEGRKGSEEGVPENLRVPLEGDRDFGELCGSHPEIGRAHV